MKEESSSLQWRTKPTDRFILKWIKLNLSAGITPRFVGCERLRPWMITVFSACLGVTAGVMFAVQMGFLGGLIASVSQVLDGVDGQFARLTERQSKGGAFLDSVLDRYADGALVIGLTIYVARAFPTVPVWLIAAAGFLAVVGSGLISYSSARAAELGIDLGPPTLAGKGTRTSVTALSGLLSVFSPCVPMAALLYLAVHPNIVVVRRLLRASKYSGPPV